MFTNYGLDLERELREQDGTEWQFGAESQPCLAAIPEKQRRAYLPVGEIQRGAEDFSDCVTRAYLNILETKFTYLYEHGKLKLDNRMWLEAQGYVQAGAVTFSDRFIAMKSGTTRTGNSLKAPVQAIHTHGLIPKSILPASKAMTWAAYHSINAITKDMEAIGQEFLRRFTLNYEQVPLGSIEAALKTDMLGIGLYGWPFPDKDGVYQRDERTFNHAVMAFGLPPTYIFDNYIDHHDKDFIKQLAANYATYNYGYRVFISQQTTPEERAVQLTVLQVLVKYGLLAFFASWWERMLKFPLK